MKIDSKISYYHMTEKQCMLQSDIVYYRIFKMLCKYFLLIYVIVYTFWSHFEFGTKPELSCFIG